MIDYLTIALTHGLIALTAWRLLSRDDLDRDAVIERRSERPDAKCLDEIPGDA